MVKEKFTSNVILDFDYPESEKIKKIGITFRGLIMVLDENGDEFSLGTPSSFIQNQKQGEHAYVGNTINETTDKEDIKKLLVEAKTMTKEYLNLSTENQQKIKLGLPIRN